LLGILRAGIQVPVLVYFFLLGVVSANIQYIVKAKQNTFLDGVFVLRRIEGVGNL
jgi:hypothetical protein